MQPHTCRRAAPQCGFGKCIYSGGAARDDAVLLFQFREHLPILAARRLGGQPPGWLCVEPILALVHPSAPLPRCCGVASTGALSVVYTFAAASQGGSGDFAPVRGTPPAPFLLEDVSTIPAYAAACVLMFEVQSSGVWLHLCAAPRPARRAALAPVRQGGLAALRPRTAAPTLCSASHFLCACSSQP